MGLNKKHALILGALLLFGGCSSVPDEMSPAKAALLAEPPQKFSTAVEAGLRKRMTVIEDLEINRYLMRIAARLFLPGKYPISIELVNETPSGFEPSVWAIPNGKIFIDIRVLKLMRFENEIAAALALGWDRSEGAAFRERMIEEASNTDPDPTKIWAFGNSENTKAIESSIERIYRAGYDPRGLVSYFDRLSTNPKKRLDSESDLLKDKARRTIAFYAPLLNPIVRTEEFYKMRKRLGKL